MPQFVTRFAPSPTGLLHAGNYRTAIFNYLFARHHKGTFVVRIEDTDKKRSKKEYEENILDSLAWLGLEYDSLHHQNEWVGEHENILKDLVNNNHAYVSKEKSEDGQERELIRFRNPNREVTFTDLVRGDITTDTTELGDFVIAKSFTEPLFHIANVADDALQGVTHIIRGEDHISNTPRQILIYEALGAHLPHYAHLPLVLATDRSKLSKRKGARPLLEYRNLGYPPEALLNYLAMLGWHPGTDEELFNKGALIERFDLDQVQKAGAVYDEAKLRWYSREHILMMNDASFQKESERFMSEKTRDALKKTGRLEDVIPVLRERIETFGDIAQMEYDGEFDYFINAPTYDTENLLWKKDQNKEATEKRLQRVHELLNAVSDDDWTNKSIKNALWGFAEAEGKGEVLWPVRFALTGQEKSPDPFTVAGILGKDETLSRIKRAAKLLTGK
ncbi:MAG: glutamate--tRNA ligase [Candidatus Paceibacteria bacterium]